MPKSLALLALAALLLTAAPAKAAVITKEIPYTHGETKLLGFYAYDDAVKGPRPGVVIVHEWWGHNDYVRTRAEQLAKLGYAAFALDMYGEGRLAKTPDEAKALADPFYADRTFMRDRARAGIEELKKQAEADKERIAAIGYCFGGTVALELARGGDPLRGVVSFHGNLTTRDPAKPDAVKAWVLALNGGADPLSPPEHKKAFAEEMMKANAKFRSIDYPGALHAFTNPEATKVGKEFDLPVAYDAEADRKSFAEMEGFLKNIF